jgi:hypothetical protein
VPWEVSFHPRSPKARDLGHPANPAVTTVLPKTRSSHKAAMNRAQILKAHGDSSGLMNGPPDAFYICCS